MLVSVAAAAVVSVVDLSPDELQATIDASNTNEMKLIFFMMIFYFKFEEYTMIPAKSDGTGVYSSLLNEGDKVTTPLILYPNYFFANGSALPLYRGRLYIAEVKKSKQLILGVQPEKTFCFVDICHATGAPVTAETVSRHRQK